MRVPGHLRNYDAEFEALICRLCRLVKNQASRTIKCRRFISINRTCSRHQYKLVSVVLMNLLICSVMPVAYRTGVITLQPGIRWFSVSNAESHILHWSFSPRFSIMCSTSTNACRRQSAYCHVFFPPPLVDAPLVQLHSTQD